MRPHGVNKKFRSFFRSTCESRVTQHDVDMIVTDELYDVCSPLCLLAGGDRQGINKSGEDGEERFLPLRVDDCR